MEVAELFPSGCAVCDAKEWVLYQASDYFLKLFPEARIGSSLLTLPIDSGHNEKSPLANSPETGFYLYKQDDAFVLLLRWTTIRTGVLSPLRFLDVLRLPVTLLGKTAIGDSILHQLLNSIYDGIWIIDNKGITIAVNKSMERIANIRPEEVVGKHVQEAMSLKKFSSCVTLHALEKKQRVSMLDDYANGHHCLNTSTPIFDDKGEVQCVIAIIRNLAELEEIHASLDEMRLHSLAEEAGETISGVDIGYWGVNSPASQKLSKAIAMAARTDAPVLLLGETGTGKTRVSKAIHQLSDRRDNKFMSINCGAIPPSLVESELFGYDAGAFTGAQKQGKKGVFELADKGTLFLDELAELPLAAQATLLHVLDGEPFRRVGGSSSVQVDVRFIAATNKPLDKLVTDGRFREDLFYRLRVIVIELPPLRERRSDIPGMVRHFLTSFCNGKPQPHLSALLWRAFMTYDWPGNIRELRSVTRFLLACDKDILSVEDLPSYIQGVLPQKSAQAAPTSLKEAVEAVEREVIRKALQEGGSTYKAARILKVSQATVVRKAQRYNLSEPVVQHN